MRLAAWAVVWAVAGGVAVSAAEDESWVGRMRKVHERFTGQKGTFAQFGDSITVTMAYWAGLQWEKKGMDEQGRKMFELVNGYMRKECWGQWKGEEYGSEGGMTVRWADENVEKWLKKLNPEVVMIMFGTNDLTQVPVGEYEQKMRSVVKRCLDNGTVVILSTIPPRSGMVEKSRGYGEAVKKIGREMGVPVVDYWGEVMKRRPEDWDGSMAKFRGGVGDEYQVRTLISRDGVHPSNPKEYVGDYSEEGLRTNGYGLRSYLTLRAYAEVVERVLR